MPFSKMDESKIRMENSFVPVSAWRTHKTLTTPHAYANASASWSAVALHRFFPAAIPKRHRIFSARTIQLTNRVFNDARAECQSERGF